ncbi:MAG TPA: leucyl aminopeptidase, partial [Xanthobacteraceae bacterium]
MPVTLKLNFTPLERPRGVLAVFCDQNLKFGPATRRMVDPMGEALRRAAAADRFAGKNGSSLDLVAPAGLD